MTDLGIDRVTALLAELGERLAGRGVEAELYVVGGAALMLSFDRTRVTRDIDAVGVPQADVDLEVRAMASDHRDLTSDWLNAQVLPLLPRGSDSDRREVFSVPGLRVVSASPRWLLAMKARAARGRRDLDDLWILCQALGLTSVDEVWAICDVVWGPAMIRDDVIEIVTGDLRARGLS